jgi:hypothetical protein
MTQCSVAQVYGLLLHVQGRRVSEANQVASRVLCEVPEDGGSTFLEKASKLLPNYTASPFHSVIPQLHKRPASI